MSVSYLVVVQGLKTTLALIWISPRSSRLAFTKNLKLDGDQTEVCAVLIK